MPVVVRVGDAAVDLRGGEDQAAAFAQRDDLVHGRDAGMGGRLGRPILARLDADLRVPLRERALFEVMQKMTEDPVTVCEVCGAPVQRVFHPIAVHFKGSGFYNTDYGTAKRKRETDEVGQRRRRQARRQAGGEEGTPSSESQLASRRRRRRRRRPTDKPTLISA